MPLHERFIRYLKDPMVDNIQIFGNLNRKAFMLVPLGRLAPTGLNTQAIIFEAMTVKLGEVLGSKCMKLKTRPCLC
jgi:hypothetical protein